MVLVAFRFSIREVVVIMVMMLMSLMMNLPIMSQFLCLQLALVHGVDSVDLA